MEEEKYHRGTSFIFEYYIMLTVVILNDVLMCIYVY